MRAILVASVALTAFYYPALADDVSQIRVVGYSPTQRTEIVGVVGQPTTITFPIGEQVYRVVQTGSVSKDGIVGDAGWQGPSPADIKENPLGNNLTLWPAAASTSTTMTVITKTANDEQKVYPFHLTSLTTGNENLTGVTFNLIFKGTATTAAATPAATPSPAAIQAWKERQAVKMKAQADAEERIRTEAFNNANGACHYHAVGPRDSPITPRCPISNGEWVLMRFPGLSQKPAVYAVTGEKNTDERLVRQHGAGDFIVVEEIDQHFRLRLGDNVLDIVDDEFNPAGTPHGSTIAPGVVRELIQAQAK